jgi:hypothetical protein
MDIMLTEHGDHLLRTALHSPPMAMCVSAPTVSASAR